jgi:hypothetical protein
MRLVSLYPTASLQNPIYDSKNPKGFFSCLITYEIRHSPDPASSKIPVTVRQVIKPGGGEEREAFFDCQLTRNFGTPKSPLHILRRPTGHPTRMRRMLKVVRLETEEKPERFFD